MLNYPAPALISVQCIHPGSKPVVGYDNIMSMWNSMFVAKDSAFAITKIKPANVKIHVRGTSAYVMCTEEVSTQQAFSALGNIRIPVFRQLTQ